MDFRTVPENLRALSDQAFQELVNKFAEVAQGFAELSADQLDDEALEKMEQLAELSAPVTAEGERRKKAANAQARAQELAALGQAPAEPEAPAETPVPAEQPVEPEAPAEPEGNVTAAQGQPPRVADVAQSRQPKAPAPTSPRLRASMVAAAEVPGIPAGAPLTNFGRAAQAVNARLVAYSMQGTSINNSRDAA